MYERLPCGIIVTAAFCEWLESWKEREAAAHFGLIPELNYVHCREGARAGQSWVSLLWRPLEGVKDHEIHAIGFVRVFFPRQTRTALRERCLDVKDGAIVVI
jgi:hypothetical protein